MIRLIKLYQVMSKHKAHQAAKETTLLKCVVNLAVEWFNAEQDSWDSSFKLWCYEFVAFLSQDNKVDFI